MSEAKTLAENLAKIRDSNPLWKARYDMLVQGLRDAGVGEGALKAGDAAPDFALASAEGQIVPMAALLAKGPVVLSFYRGKWCPYCVTELEIWRDLHTELRSMGALLVAISPQTRRQNDFAVQQHELPFPVLSDEGAVVAGQFGVAYSVAQDHRRYYQGILVNIPFVNSGSTYKNATESSWNLPLPGLFVVRQDGTIAFSEAHADFRVRPEPADVMSVIASL